MQRKPVNSEFTAELMPERLASVLEGPLPLEEKLRHLTVLRAGVPPEEIDRALVDRIGHLHGGLRKAQAQQEELGELLEKLTVPPYFPAVFISSLDTDCGTRAAVRLGSELRVVALGDAVAESDLTPGDEVLLANERNVIVGKSGTSCFRCGEVAAFSHFLESGGCVVKVRDEELVLVAGAGLRSAGLHASDQVRVDRTVGLAFEKVERSRGDEYFLQETPQESFANIGGLDREIEQIKRVFDLHYFNRDIVHRYQLKPKRSILLYGPSGTGKTMLARALANWLAQLSKHGRCRFGAPKPGSLSSMWYGMTEQNLRDIFRVAREAAAEEPEVPTVLFFDEVDSLGAMRGESIHRIDDRVLNAFMAELSGLEDRGNVVVVSATNLLSLLDTAVVRNGRLGDVVIKIPRPNRRAAREIFHRHMPSEIPYACNGEGPAAARQAMINSAVSQIYAADEDSEVSHLTFRDGKRRVVRASEMINGAEIASIAQAAIEGACLREAQGGTSGVELHDVLDGVADFLEKSRRLLTPANCRHYLGDLPQDVDVVRVEPVQRTVRNPYRYFNQVA